MDGTIAINKWINRRGLWFSRQLIATNPFELHQLFTMREPMGWGDRVKRNLEIISKKTKTETRSRMDLGQEGEWVPRRAKWANTIPGREWCTFESRRFLRKSSQNITTIAGAKVLSQCIIFGLCAEIFRMAYFLVVSLCCIALCWPRLREFIHFSHFTFCNIFLHFLDAPDPMHDMQWLSKYIVDVVPFWCWPNDSIHYSTVDSSATHPKYWCISNEHLPERQLWKCPINCAPSSWSSSIGDW